MCRNTNSHGVATTTTGENEYPINSLPELFCCSRYKYLFQMITQYLLVNIPIWDRPNILHCAVLDCRDFSLILSTVAHCVFCRKCFRYPNTSPDYAKAWSYCNNIHKIFFNNKNLLMRIYI